MADLVADALAALRQRSDWAPARTHFQALSAKHRTQIDQRVRAYPGLYAGSPAAMVVDVVLSNQRDYVKIVVPLVQAWMTTHSGWTLAELAQAGPWPIPRLQKNSRRDETATIQQTAAGLSSYCKSAQLAEAQGILQWAEEVEPFRFTWYLDPHVGAVRGIGIALFAYLRMLCGADGIKPDSRVRQALGRSGLTVPAADAGLLLLAEAMAAEIGVTRLWFDQLLWYAA